MTIEALKAALDAGPTSAFYTHPRDDNKWKENEAFALACDPATIRALLTDALRYQWLRDTKRLYLGPVIHMGAARERSGMRYILASMTLGSAQADTETLDAAIDAAMAPSPKPRSKRAAMKDKP